MSHVLARNTVDVILIGTGLAPLVAASRLLSQGLEVAILNPDRDFFLENSEVSMDPDPQMDVECSENSKPARIIEILRPDFPGAVELFPVSGGGGFRDESAPHVRVRSKLWVEPVAVSPGREKLEEAYLKFTEKGWDARMFEGLAASHRFPGHSKKGGEGALGLGVSGFGDVDVDRYRHGLLEYVRERANPDAQFMEAHGIELIPEGVRFQLDREAHTLRARGGVLAFWTPKLSTLIQSWIGSRMKSEPSSTFAPTALKAWEEWTLVSRDPLDWEQIGIQAGLFAFAEVEGAFEEDGDKKLHRLSVWTKSSLHPVSALLSRDIAEAYVAQSTFQDISRLCQDFLGWGGFSVRSVKPRVLFEWGGDPASESLFDLPHGSLRTSVVTRVEGPIAQVVRTARAATEKFLS